MADSPAWPSGPAPAAGEPGPEQAVVARLRAAGCVFAEDEARLLMAAAATPAELDDLVGRREAGLPLEYILGWAQFCGLRIAVAPGVFVPRPRTEFLVSQAAALPVGARPVIVDLCCGSGAIAAALAATLSRSGVGPGEVHAADIDPAAVACARRNLARAGGQAWCGDLFEPLPGRLRGRVRILTANVPYVPSGDVRLLPAESREHEPRSTVDGGQDGLDLLRRVSAAAPGWLAPGGYLLSEVSDRQAAAAAGILSSNGLAPVISRSDELAAIVVTGQRSSGRAPRCLD
jgi:release factor glutamine methyltransferase